MTAPGTSRARTACGQALARDLQHPRAPVEAHQLTVSHCRTLPALSPPCRLGGPLGAVGRDQVEINGVAHIVLRVSRFEACIAFYDVLMPRLGLEAVFRSDGFVYYVGGRTGVGIRRPEPQFAAHAHEEFAPGIDHLCFRAGSREDIEELYELVQNMGAEVVRPQPPPRLAITDRDLRLMALLHGANFLSTSHLTLLGWGPSRERAAQMRLKRLRPRRGRGLRATTRSRSATPRASAWRSTTYRARACSPRARRSRPPPIIRWREQPTPDAASRPSARPTLELRVAFPWNQQVAAPWWSPT
jgi:catechol 2,3-dioxygenase-like lactoylglutathione lyase family enzyme